MEMEKRKVSDSIVETVHMVRPQHLNASDRLFGGALMQWIDEVAGMVAKRHTRRNVITASVDSLSFLRGAYVKDTVVIIGKVTYVGNTSMEVKVDTYVEALSGERTPINHAYFTMVALDKNDRPVRVPRLELETEEEKELWKYVKAADKISAYIKCLEERKTGNMDFADAEQTIYKAITDMHMDEVDYFMKEYIPAYMLTLDESGDEYSDN